jgi:hypothetical protein
MKLPNLILALGLGIIFSFCLALPQPGFAVNQDELALVERLRGYTRQQGDFKPILGEERFEERTTGLKDPSPYVRVKAAEMIADYGDTTYIAVLFAAEQRESDALVKQLISFCREKLVSREETRRLGRLWERTAQAQGENRFNALLGIEDFAGGKTGLKSPSPYIRALAAEMLSELGAEAQTQYLLTAAKAEENSQAREGIYLAYARLGLRYAQNKEGFVQGFLDECRDAKVSFGEQGIPKEAFKLLIQQAQDKNMQGLRGKLEGLSPALKDDQEMQALVKDTSAVLDFSRQCNTEACWEAALLSSQPAVQEWAMRALVKENSAGAQDQVNSLLIKLLTQKTGRVFLLKQLMDEEGILRSENANPHLEFGDRFLEQWQINPQYTVTYPMGGPYSFERCLEVNNPSGSTELVNTRTEFSGANPLRLEYGLAYKMAEQEMVSEETPFREKPTLRLKLGKITLVDGTTVEDEEIVVTPSSEFNWTLLQGSYQAPQPIRSVQLVVMVSGQAHIYLDDIYVRRAGDYFINSPPRINSLGVSTPVALLRNTTPPSTGSITFYADITDPEAGPVTGSWSSDIEGQLGEGREKSVSLTRVGKHTIEFVARDEFGLEDKATITIEVRNPVEKRKRRAGAQKG